MKVIFPNLDCTISCTPDQIETLQIENHPLYAKIASSFVSLKGEAAIEPYLLEDNNEKSLIARSNLVVLASPLILPFSDRTILSALYKSLEESLIEHDEIRSSLQTMESSIESQVTNLSLPMEGNYSFGVQWDLSHYLRAFSFKIDIDECGTLLDKCIAFMQMVADLLPDRVIVCIGFKQFFNKNELNSLIKQILFLKLKVLLIESNQQADMITSQHITTIDQDFIVS